MSDRDEWQPIATAPRDGTRFLAWFPPNVQALSGAIGIIQWHAGDWYSVFFTAPTHWRPLPPPPRGDADGR